MYLHMYLHMCLHMYLYMYLHVLTRVRATGSGSRFQAWIGIHISWRYWVRTCSTGSRTRGKHMWCHAFTNKHTNGYACISVRSLCGHQIVCVHAHIQTSHHSWAPLMSTTYEHHLWAPPMSTTHEHHPWAPLMSTTHEHHSRAPLMSTTHEILIYQ